MGKSGTKDKALLIEKNIEDVFRKCGIQYSKVDFGDDDLNYSIDFDASDLVSGIGKLNALIYFTTNKPKCTLMIGNIFKFKEDDNRPLEIANRINRKLNTGKVIVTGEQKQLVFIDGRVLEDSEQIDEELIQAMIVSAKVGIAIIYSDIEGYMNEK